MVDIDQAMAAIKSPATAEPSEPAPAEDKGATPGQGTATTVLSAITTGLLALNGNGGFGGFFGGNNNISAMAIAQKDAEIAMLKADNETDRKLVEVYNALFKNDKEQNAKIEAIHTNLAILNTQMAQVMGLTALHIPATNVCPLPMTSVSLKRSLTSTSPNLRNARIVQTSFLLFQLLSPLPMTLPI